MHRPTPYPATTAPASGATTTPGSGSAAVLDTDCTNPGEAVTPPPPPTTGPKAETLPPEAAGAAGALEGFKGTTPHVKHSDDFKRTIRQRVDEARSALDEQYELLFEEEFGQLRLAETETAAGG